MSKIVVVKNLELYPDQIRRLKSLGTVKIYKDNPRSPEEWLIRCKNADIICSGKFGLEKIYDLKNVFISLPFVGIEFLKKDKLKENNINVSNCPGCNRDAVSEWIIAMMINLTRQFPQYIKCKKLPGGTLKANVGLTGKTVCILGKGNIGSRVGEICRAFDTNVNYFRRGDNLLDCTKDADIIVDCLSSNPTTEKLLDKKFFRALKKDSYFITITSKTCDTDAMIEALDKNILAGVAHDAAEIGIGNVSDPLYVKLRKHKKILTTPHIAYNSDVTNRVGNDMMIDNVEAWIKGKPINLIK
jgi:phosphoglycerate dehydrogenase-like enzyme